MVLFSIAIVCVAFEWERIASHLSNWVDRATGRDFEIRGDIDLDFSWWPRLVVEDVTFENSPWSADARAPMLEVGRVSVRIDLRELARGNLVLPELRLEDVTLLLEQRADGRANWQLEGEDAVERVAVKTAVPEDRAEMPAVWHFSLRNARIVYSREGAPDGVDLHVARAEGSLGARAVLEAEGTYQKQPARLSLAAGPVSALRDERTPYPIDVALVAGATSAHVDGTLSAPLRFAGLDLDMQLAGETLSDLYPLLGVVLPPSPPYALQGRLERRGAVWSFADFSGRLGDSDFTGDLSIDPAGRRPHMKADFASRRLDFDDLNGLVGGTPDAGADETASVEQRAEAAAETGDGRVLADDPIELPRLRAMDIDARLRAERVIAPSLPIDRLDLAVTVRDGVLRTSPAAFDVAGGRVDLRATLDGNRAPPQVAASVHARGLRLEELFADTRFADQSGGSLSGQLDVSMQGFSLREMAGTADGGGRLAMSDARLSHLLVELIGLDVFESVGVLLSGDEPLDVECAVADLTARDGLAHSNAIVIDTADTNITAGGALDLRQENLDLLVEPHPKDPSLLSLRAPIRVEGPLDSLDYYPDPLRLGPGGTLLATANFALTPVIGLVTPFDSGLDDSDRGCEELRGGISAEQSALG